MAHHLQRIGDLVIGRHGDGIDNHAALRSFHLVDLAGLLLDGEIAMAMRDSVTVSMAALIRGIWSRILRVRRVDVSAAAGTTSDLAGSSNTSSKVSASGTGK